MKKTNNRKSTFGRTNLISKADQDLAIKLAKEQFVKRGLIIQNAPPELPNADFIAINPETKCEFPVCIFNISTRLH